MLPLLVRVDLGAMVMKLQHYWNLIIRLFRVISGHSSRGGVLTPLQRSSRWILQPQPTGQPTVWVKYSFLSKVIIFLWLEFRISYKKNYSLTEKIRIMPRIIFKGFLSVSGIVRFRYSFRHSDVVYVRVMVEVMFRARVSVGVGIRVMTSPEFVFGVVLVRA